MDIGENETHNMDNISDSVCGMKRLKRLLNEVQSQGVDIMQTEPPLSHVHKDVKEDQTFDVCSKVFRLAEHWNTLILNKVGGIAALIFKSDCDGHYSVGDAMDIKMMLDVIGYKKCKLNDLKPWYQMCQASISKQKIIDIFLIFSISPLYK